jgi:membrane protein YqaA with SNARE-associated domain
LETLNQFFSSDLSEWGLFISSFVSATLLPGSSELVLIGLLKLHPELHWTLVAIGTAGNTLGAMVTFALSWFLPLKHEIKHVDKVRHYGTPALLLSWAPFIGDVLVAAAGWLRLNPWHSLLFIALGKWARYAIIAWITL